MATPVIQVLLKLKDELSEGLNKAGNGIKGFFTSIGGLVATAVLGKFLKDSVEEAGKSEASMARLALAVRNTGNDFQKLQPSLSGTIDSLARLTTFTDEDLSDALANLVTITGDVSGSQKNLALVTDLATAKHMDLSAASDVVGKAMNGNVTALNKMGFAGKDATSAIESLRTSVNGAAADFANTFQGRLENLSKGWGEFKESVGRAILSTGSAGEAVGGLTKMLADSAGWVERNQNAIGALVDGLTSFGSVLSGPLAWTVQKFIAGLLGIEYAIGQTLNALAWLLEKGGGLLRKLGFDVGDGLAKTLRENGEKMITASEQAIAKLNTKVSEADIARTKAAEIQAAKRLKLTKDQLAAQQKAEEQYAKDLEAANVELVIKLKMLDEGWTEAQAKEWVKRQQNMGQSLGMQATTLEDAYSKIDQANLLLAAGFDKIIPKVKQTETSFKLAATEGALPFTTQAELLAKKLGITTEEAEKLVGKFATVAARFVDGGRAAIGMAQGLGLLDDQAAAALQNVLTLGDSLKKISVEGIGAGLPGLIGGLAGVLGSIFAGDAERLAMIRRNAAATEKLASINGELVSLSTPGRSFAGVKSVLESAGTGSGQGTKARVVQGLLDKGLGLSDLTDLAKDLGIDLKVGTHGIQGLDDLLAAIGQVQFSSFADTFSDQLKRIGIGKGIGAIGAGEELGQTLGAVGVGGDNAILQALQGLDLSGANAFSGRLDTNLADQEALAKRIAAYQQDARSSDSEKAFAAQQALDTILLPQRDALKQQETALRSAMEAAQAPVNEAVANLRQLFNNIGTLTPEQFGGLTGPEFLDAIERVIGLLTDDIADLGGVLVPGGIATGTLLPDLPITMDLMTQQGQEQIDVLGEINAGIQELITVQRSGGGAVAFTLTQNTDAINAALAKQYQLDQLTQGSAART